jgi:hypothetical protein
MPNWGTILPKPFHFLPWAGTIRFNHRWTQMNTDQTKDWWMLDWWIAGKRSGIL